MGAKQNGIMTTVTSSHPLPPFLYFLFSALLSTSLFSAEDHSKLYAETSPSVVTLKVYDSLGTLRGQGSGFVATKDGTVVTCLHVIDQAEVIQILFPDGSTTYAMSIASVDSASDLATILGKKITHLPLALDTDDLAPGKPVVAIGSPLGMSNTISTGIISGIRPDTNYRGSIQFTSPISGGSSGGPLLNHEGKVIGIVTATEPAGQNINFAIGADKIQALLKSIDPDSPFKKLKPVSNELREKIEGGQGIRNAIMRDCAPEDVVALDTMIEEAIMVGVDIYNAGHALGCFRVYEGTAYKILNKLGDRSELIQSTLEKALKNADDKKPADTRAWVMRGAFDTLLGVPTQAQ